MARRKNVKRIDPRYFLNETVNRGEEIGEGYMSNRRGDRTQGHMTDMFNSDDPQYPGRPFVLAAAGALDMGRSEALDAVWVREYEGKAIAGWVRDAIADIARRERGAGYRGDHSKANREARMQFRDNSMVGQVEEPRQVQGMDFAEAVEVFKLEPLKWDPDVYGDIYDKVWRRERGY